jgi:hypothetical protein
LLHKSGALSNNLPIYGPERGWQMITLIWTLVAITGALSVVLLIAPAAAGP